MQPVGGELGCGHLTKRVFPSSLGECDCGEMTVTFRPSTLHVKCVGRTGGARQSHHVAVAVQRHDTSGPLTLLDSVLWTARVRPIDTYQLCFTPPRPLLVSAPT
jgi:hypothetical protein